MRCTNDWSRIFFLFYTFFFIYVFRNNKKSCGLAVYCLGLIYIKKIVVMEIVMKIMLLAMFFPHGVTYHKYKGHCGVIIKKNNFQVNCNHFYFIFLNQEVNRDFSLFLIKFFCNRFSIFFSFFVDIFFYKCY